MEPYHIPARRFGGQAIQGAPGVRLLVQVPVFDQKARCLIDLTISIGLATPSIDPARHDMPQAKPATIITRSRPVHHEGVCCCRGCILLDSSPYTNVFVNCGHAANYCSAAEPCSPSQACRLTGPPAAQSCPISAYTHSSSRVWQGWPRLNLWHPLSMAPTVQYSRRTVVQRQRSCCVFGAR